MKHFVYMLECADGSLYTGYTTDVVRREKEHNGKYAGLGAKYTRARRPVKVVFKKSFKTRSEAMQYEAEIKKLKRTVKLELIS